MTLPSAVSEPSAQQRRWHRVDSAQTLRQEAARRILHAAQCAIALHGMFRIVLAGGSTPRGVYRLLRNAPTAWARWQIYFSDERCLPVDHPQRNSAMAQREWLAHVALPPSQIHRIPAERGAVAAADAYDHLLQGVGDFDLVLLGLGRDGHTASLFEGHDLGLDANSADALPVLNAPQSPPQRVTLSAARLSRTREVLFLVAGASKSEALARWTWGADLPAAAIRPPGSVDILVSASSQPQSVSVQNDYSAA